MGMSSAESLEEPETGPGFPGTQHETRTNPADSRQQATISENEDHEAKSGGAILSDNTGLGPAERIVGESQSSEPPMLQPSSNHIQRRQSQDHEFNSMRYEQIPMQDEPDDAGAAPAISIETLEEPPSTGSTRPNPGPESEGHPIKRTCYMVIHLPNGQHALRIGCLDTMADLDAVSHHVVKSLGLKEEKYFGPPVRPLGGYFEPETQVTVEWHISERHKTYKTTFAVLDEKHSGDFDILLGHRTIETVGFYLKNVSVWMLPAKDPVEFGPE
ncbi:MAG: hypothetical protein Q9196_006111 [Gyalolechia fulgens]